MKRIFVVALTLCIGACASQPQKTITAEQPVIQSSDTSVAANNQKDRPYTKVFMDDYELIHVTTSPAKRRNSVLGKKSG